MTIEVVSNYVANFDPWWMIAIALLLILLDWFLLETDALSVVGFSIFLLAILNFSNAPDLVQLWSYPILLFVSYYGNRKFISKFRQAKVPFEDNNFDNLVGKTATLAVVEGAITGSDHFYKYKKNIEVENYQVEPGSPHQSLYKAHFSDGKVLPAQLAESRIPRDGATVEVIAVRYGTVMVKTREDEDV
jgi:membrane protein implicated in regulation of membrane protease activity